MTDRDIQKDRLIELLKQIKFDFEEECVACIENGYKAQPMLEEFFADGLLANGVIKPPCKVGDTVYMITANGNIRNLTILSIDIELEKKEIKMTCLAVYEFEDKPCYMQIQSFKFGKTVFLTKEEAEEKLKELRNNGSNG